MGCNCGGRAPKFGSPELVGRRRSVHVLQSETSGPVVGGGVSVHGPCWRAWQGQPSALDAMARMPVALARA
eukprot:7260042-Heterocapsa_arctica.AAC.1